MTALVVEDEFLIAMDLERLLTQHGWRVLGPAATVKQALRLLGGERPDVAILDVSLKGESVARVAEALRALNIPFVLASAHHRPDRLAGEVLSGAVNVGKPTDEHRLLAALSHALER